jgi:hypothetical protein
LCTGAQRRKSRGELATSFRERMEA